MKHTQQICHCRNRFIMNDTLDILLILINMVKPESANLRAYYIIYKPKEYLFNGSRVGGPMSMRNIQRWHKSGSAVKIIRCIPFATALQHIWWIMEQICIL